MYVKYLNWSEAADGELEKEIFYFQCKSKMQIASGTVNERLRPEQI